MSYNKIIPYYVLKGWQPVMDAKIADDLYTRLIDVNGLAFEAGLFDAAYHALMGALYCGEQVRSNEPLQNVSKIAIKQSAWIDQYAPNYKHSTRSAFKHGLPESIYSRISTQAETILKMRSMNRRHENKS